MFPAPCFVLGDAHVGAAPADVEETLLALLASLGALFTTAAVLHALLPWDASDGVQLLHAAPIRLGLLLVAALVVVTLVSAVAVVASSHQTREQYARLQRLEREQNQLQTEWGQLLLEESAWSSPAGL